jgi:hypothetical protein
MAVTYAVMDSIDTILGLLETSLAGATDLKECWIRALERSRTEIISEIEWRRLLEKSTSVVAIGDILRLIPPDMKIEPFQEVIQRSLIESRARSDKCAADIESLTVRCSMQRETIKRGPIMALELEALATCWLCKIPIYSERFLAFPCEHTVHLKCLLANMHIYFSPSEQLDLISRAARVSRDEAKITGLREKVCRSCVICGEVALNGLNKDFVRKYDDAQKRLWSLPSLAGVLPNQSGAGSGDRRE